MLDDRLLVFAVCCYLPPSLTRCLLTRIFDFPESIIVAVAVSLDVAVAIAISLDVVVAVSLDVAISLVIAVTAVRDSILCGQQVRSLVQLPCKDGFKQKNERLVLIFCCCCCCCCCCCNNCCTGWYCSVN